MVQRQSLINDGETQQEMDYRWRTQSESYRRRYLARVTQLYGKDAKDDKTPAQLPLKGIGAQGR